MKMLFRLAFLTCVFSILCSNLSHGRDFVDKNGRKISAKIVGVQGQNVTMQMGVKKYTFPITNLSDADQEFVKEWAKKNKTYRFDFTAKKAEDNTKRNREGDGKDKTVLSSWAYDVAVFNRSGEDLENLEVKYNIIVRHTKTAKELEVSGRQKSETPQIIAGTTKIAKSDNSKPFSFVTELLPMKSRKWQVEKTTLGADGNSKIYFDDYSEETELDGIWIKVFLDGRMIAEWQSDGKLIKKVVWSDTNNDGGAVPVPPAIK